jgi:AcrR family transcriptional regulator
VSSETSTRVRRKPARRYHHGDLRASCLALAARELEAKGPEGLALRHLAERLGVTQPSLYRHFAAKEALVDALAIQGFVALRARLAAAGGETARARLMAMMRAYLAHGLAQPQHYRLMFARPAAEKRRDAALVEIAASARQDLAEAVAAWFSEADGSPAAVAEVSVSLWALAHGLVMLASEGHLPREGIEAICEASLARLLPAADA